MNNYRYALSILRPDSEPWTSSKPELMRAAINRLSDMPPHEIDLYPLRKATHTIGMLEQFTGAPLSDVDCWIIVVYQALVAACEAHIALEDLQK